MLKNPLIQRYRYSLLRPSHFLIYATIYISVVLLLLFINYTLYQHQDTYSSPQKLCEGIYFQFLTFQIIILWFWGAFSSASAVKEEITGKTYDFFRMLPLAAHRKTIGILLGKNLLILLLAAVNCLLLIFFGLAGLLSINLQLQVFLALFSIAILINSIALLSSINPTQKSKKKNILATIIIIYFGGSFLIGPFFGMSSIEKLETVTAWFFGIKLPVLVLISLIALYFSCWTIKGILRRFTREDEPLFTRKGALLFMLGFELILIGLLCHHLLKGDKDAGYVYWLISMLAVVTVPLGAFVSFEKYLEDSGLIWKKNGSNGKIISRIPLNSNMSLALGLFLIWAAGSIATILIGKMEFLRGLQRIWVLFTFYLFLMLLLELHVLYKPLSRKIGHLLIFIFIVYVALPPILSATLQSEIIYLYSPVGFFWIIIDESFTGKPPITSIWCFNILFCIIPIILIRKRFNHILNLRQKM